MDECIEPVSNVIFEIPKPIPTSSDTSTSTSGSSTSTSTSNTPIKTFSMLNWETQREDMPDNYVGSMMKTDSSNNKGNNMNDEIKFMIDSEEIFTVESDEYFVVI